MKDLFEDFLERKNEAPWRSKRILVAVSGGVDSMVLAHLLVQSGCQLALAHCNYQLRDGDSDLDEQLVKDWAAEHAVPVFSRQFPTKQILAEQGGNLQETARRLRYDWFEELSQSEGFHYIATAHHAQDAVETLLYNLFTGTGIAGLHGILALQGKLIRPLLPYFKEDIIRFAKANAIPWREDKSNAHSNYSRNKIRNVLLPEIDRVFPGVVAQLTNNIQRFHDAEIIYQQGIERYRKKLIEVRDSGVYIAVRKIRNCQPLATILGELLRPYGFRYAQIPDVAHLLEAETGKYVCSATHRVLRNREHLIVSALAPTPQGIYLVEEADSVVTTGDFQLQTKEEPWLSESPIPRLPSSMVMIDREQLIFPLILRPWKTGDYFYPLGLNKKKKLSRFLIDLKIPLHEKSRVWVLESNRKIVWVLGYRIDHRFRIEKDTKSVLSLKLVPKAG